MQYELDVKGRFADIDTKFLREMIGERYQVDVR